MPEIISRKAWGARPPRNRWLVPWSMRTEFFVHHTDGPTNQTIKSIQNFHMDTRGWADIGYGHLVDDDGLIYEGRGWRVVGAHCPGHNTSGESVAYIGKNAPTEAALRSIRWLYDEACRLSGRRLVTLGHGQRYPTECPASELQAWVNKGMPIDSPPPLETTWTETLVKDLPTLRPGDEAWDVKTLRWLLGARGYPPHDLLSRVYDDELKADVVTFQTGEKLDPDAAVGEKTWRALLRL